jgi:4-amino-4-deoxychorismate lyase
LTIADAAEPALSVLDAGVARGDGIFETLGVIDGSAHGVDAHLERLGRSAAMLDLPAPNAGQWRHAIARAEEALRSSPGGAAGQAAMRLVMTRGVEGRGATCWVTVSAAGSRFPERDTGVSVVTLDRGYRSDVAESAPWLLAGAKTLSYAVNMAALREARRRGADDVVFVSSDGYALEGPTSTLIARFGDQFVTPKIELGILPGTTQLAIFEALERSGRTTAYSALQADRLVEADALWLVSSVRLAAPIRELDGQAVRVDAELTEWLNAELLGRDA